MSVSVLRNSREQPPLVTAVDCGGASLKHGDGDGGGGKASIAGTSPRTVAPMVASAAVASHSKEERTRETSLNNNLERKGIKQPSEAVRVDEAAQYQPPPPQPKNSVGIPVTRNFKTSASTSTDVRAVARRACAPKSAGFGSTLFNRQQVQSGYRPRRRVHSVSGDDGNVTTRPDIFNGFVPKRLRFSAKTQSTYQFQQQKGTFIGNSTNREPYVSRSLKIMSLTSSPVLFDTSRRVGILKSPLGRRLPLLCRPVSISRRFPNSYSKLSKNRVMMGRKVVNTKVSQKSIGRAFSNGSFNTRSFPSSVSTERFVGFSGYRRTGEPRFLKRARSGTNPLLNQPPAPNNTTQFLITDREEREDLLPSTSSAEVGADVHDTTLPANPIHAATDDQPINAAGNEEPCSSSGNRRRNPDDVDFDEEFIEDPEFAAVCDDYNLERIMSMSRDEVNREMLETQKDNLHLNEKVEILRADNLRLRAMLRDCGYDDVSAPTSLCATAIFPAALRKSASPDTTLVYSGDDVVPTAFDSTSQAGDPE